MRRLVIVIALVLAGCGSAATPAPPGASEAPTRPTDLAGLTGPTAGPDADQHSGAPGSKTGTTGTTAPPKPVRTARPKPAWTTVPTPSPAPTPAPTPELAVSAPVAAMFFGPGVKVTFYKVAGDTPEAIRDSIDAHGPPSKWLGERAEALTQTSLVYRITLVTTVSTGACRLRLGSPAVALRTSIILPRWVVPRNPDPATIAWWNAEIRATASHERVHYRMWAAAVKKMNTAAAHAACGNVMSRINKIRTAARRANCEYDMKEYGTAAGLSLKACIKG